jgi:hypothetical protein
MITNTDFLTNGYAGQLIDKIFESYAAKVFINSYDVLVLRRFVPDSGKAVFVNSSRLRLNSRGLVPSFEIDLMVDARQSQGSLRFEGQYEPPNLLASSNILPGNRLESFALIGENGDFLIL